MNHRTWRLQVLGWTATSLLLASPVLALSPTPISSDEPLTDYFTNRSQCLDQYKYGSVTFDIVSSANISVAAGQTLNISANVKNTNDFPLPEGRVYAHVLRQDATVAAENWHPLVYEGDVPGDFSLKANEQKAFSFSWQAPSQAPAGVYRVEFFYLAGGRFVMGGLPYTPAVSGGSTLFAIKQSSKPAYVEFDRSSVTLAGKSLALRAVPPTLPATAPVKISVDLRSVHQTAATQATVTTSLYRWSITDSKAPLTTKTATVSVAPNGTVVIPFIWDSPEAGAYEIVFEATTGVSGELPTRLKFRFPVEGNTPRIMFSGITGTDGDNVEVTTCAVNSTFGTGEGNLTTSVASSSGQQLGTTQTTTRANSLSSSVLLVPKTALAAGIGITTEAQDSAGIVTDTHTTHYSAALLSDILPNAASPASTENNPGGSRGAIIAAVAVFVLIGLGLGVYLWRKRIGGSSMIPPQNLNPPTV